VTFVLTFVTLVVVRAYEGVSTVAFNSPMKYTKLASEFGK